LENRIQAAFSVDQLVDQFIKGLCQDKIEKSLYI